MKARIAALKHGYRSGLEERIAEQLKKLNIDGHYEENTILYVIPETLHKYRPDFTLPNGIVIESKGRFITADRMKHLHIKKQSPDLDIRFVFTNPNAKISKVSKTSYAAWCDKHGFQYAKGLIPLEWINEEKK